MMTEREARDWLQSQFNVSRETLDRLNWYIAALLAEGEKQNLIAESTRNEVWARHIVDSAQLLLHAPDPTADALWVDLGSGAGLPGVIIAIMSGYDVLMIEMRRKRAEFLEAVIADLGLANANVFCSKAERAQVVSPARVISARAYAPMERLIPSALHLADFSTIWLLPKGQNYENELAIAQSLWHCEACAEPSVTSPESAIVRLRHVQRLRHGVKTGKVGGRA